LEFELFTTDTVPVRSFDCGNRDLNEFLCSEEVKEYEKELFGKTSLVNYRGNLVAYYTISNSLLRKEYVGDSNNFLGMGEYRVEGIPAITIGRLAVDKIWQNKGIGRVIMQRIAMIALDSSRQSGIRLILVQAKEEAFDFYGKLGYRFTVETRRERSRFQKSGTRTMYFDMKSLNFLDE